MDLLLYHRPDCPFCWKLMIALHELDIPYAEVATRLGEKHADVVALSPSGTVPVLVDRRAGLVIPESAVALEYVNEMAGGGLFGGDAASRARVRTVAAYSDGTVGGALRDIIFEKRAKPEADWDRDRIREGTARWAVMLDRLETWVSPDGWFGPAFSAADCALAARFGLAEAYGAGVTARHPRLHDWYGRASARPSFRATRPDRFPMYGVTP